MKRYSLLKLDPDGTFGDAAEDPEGDFCMWKDVKVRIDHLEKLLANAEDELDDLRNGHELWGM